jgi:hypothetical protein
LKLLPASSPEVKKRQPEKLSGCLGDLNEIPWRKKKAVCNGNGDKSRVVQKPQFLNNFR